MNDPARKLATYEDLAGIPEHHIGQLVDGELHVQPRPTAGHSTVASGLGFDIGGPFDRGRGGPGGWWIRAEVELHFGRNVLVPDLAGWRKDRLPIFPKDASVSIAPDWVCEVLSPSTARFDRIRKMPVYLREGVTHVWLLDPEQKTLEIFRSQGEAWMLVGVHSETDRVRAEPFDAIELELGALWPSD